jgi:hypothetical protein
MQHVHALEDPSMHADGPTGYMQVFESCSSYFGIPWGKKAVSFAPYMHSSGARLGGPIQELPVDAMLGSLTTTDTKESPMDMP